MIKIDNRKYSWIILFSVVIAILLTVAVNEPTHGQDAANAKKAASAANAAKKAAVKAQKAAEKAAQTAQTAAEKAQTAAKTAAKSNKIGILPLQFAVIAVLILLLVLIIYLVFYGIPSDKKKQINSFTNSEIALLKKSIQNGATIPSVKKVESPTATTNVTRNIDTTPNDPTSKFNETLTQWWTANATKSSSECIKGLTEKFGEESNPDGENEHQGQFDKYKVLTVTAGTKQFLIPCKDIVYDDFITKFFCVDGDSYIKGSSLITSLIRPAIKDSTGNISRGMLDVTPPSVGSEPIRQPVITEPKRPVLDDKKLIDWWNKNSTSELTKCKNSLEERFGNEIFVELISWNENSEEDWFVIGITEPLSEEVYVLPRRRTLIGNIRVWFETSNKISKLTLIKSLVKTARSAKSNPKKVKEMGVITIAEE